MEVSLAKEYSAIREDLLHYLENYSIQKNIIR